MKEAKSKDQQLKSKRLIATSIASPIASVVTKYACHPIDTIKSKVQARASKMHRLSEYKVGHSLDLIKQTWKNEGIKGFFRGVTLSAFGSIIAFSAYMSAYEKTKQKLQTYQFFQKYPSLNHLIAGFNAQIFSCIFWLPIDIIKERMQVQSEVKIYNYSGPREAFKKISSTQGIIGLYRAFGATLIFFGPTSAIFFVCYEKLKTYLVANQKSPTLLQSIVCSSGAGAVSGFLTTPLEMVKLRMQIQRADSASKGNIAFQKTLYGYKNIFHGLYSVYLNQGVFALYKGAGLRVIFTIPAFSISISLTQSIRNQILQKKMIESLF